MSDDRGLKIIREENRPKGPASQNRGFFACSNIPGGRQVRNHPPRARARRADLPSPPDPLHVRVAGVTSAASSLPNVKLLSPMAGDAEAVQGRGRRASRQRRRAARLGRNPNRASATSNATSETPSRVDCRFQSDGGLGCMARALIGSLVRLREPAFLAQHHSVSPFSTPRRVSVSFKRPKARLSGCRGIATVGARDGEPTAYR